MGTRSDTRKKLIATARELFWRQGYGATGVAQILKTAGVNSGSLYYFFPTKEDLLIAVLEWYKANLGNEVVDPVLTRVADPVERIFGILDGYRRLLLMTEFLHGCPIGNLALEVGDTHPAVRALIAENFAGWREAVKLCLEAACDRLPGEVERGQLASFVLSVMEGGVMQSRSAHSIEPFEASVAILRDYFERLIADASGWSRPPRAASLFPETAPDHPREQQD